MSLLNGLVAQNRWAAVEVQNYGVNISIVVEIVKRGGAAAFNDLHPAATHAGHIGKFSLSVILQQIIADFHARSIVNESDVVHEVPASDEDIAVAIVIEIDEPHSPGHMRKQTVIDARLIGHILKKPGTNIAVIHGHFVLIRGC